MVVVASRQRAAVADMPWWTVLETLPWTFACRVVAVVVVAAPPWPCCSNHATRPSENDVVVAAAAVVVAALVEEPWYWEHVAMTAAAAVAVVTNASDEPLLPNPSVVLDAAVVGADAVAATADVNGVVAGMPAEPRLPPLSTKETCDRVATVGA